MIKKINKVAVLGTGVMGAQIAAHLSNVKIPVYVFDMNQEIEDILMPIYIYPKLYFYLIILFPC